VKPTPVSLAQARRIAVRAQLLDGSADGVLETVRRLGFLQIDPISTVAPPQRLVLWSRLGPHDSAELDRLLWEERKLVEWGAFIWPIEDFPLIRARMRRRRGKQKYEQQGTEFLRRNARFKRHLLRELEERGPLLSREIEADLMVSRDPHAWWGSRKVTLMLQLLEGRGVVAIVGRRGSQRLWDLAERWFPETESIPWPEAERLLAAKRFRALGVRFENGGWRAHPDAEDGPMPSRVTFLSPFDRLIHDRDRAEALWDFRYRLRYSSICPRDGSPGATTLLRAGVEARCRQARPADAAPAAPAEASGPAPRMSRLVGTAMSEHVPRVLRKGPCERLDRLRYGGALAGASVGGRRRS